MPNKTRISLPFQLLKTFTEKELISFEKLLNSGYLNKNLINLLKILKKQALHLSSFSSDLQCEVYQVLYNKESVGKKLLAQQGKKLNRVMNELLSAAEKFLMFEDIKDTDEHDALLLFPKLIDRNQLLLYSKRIKATEKKLSKEKKKGIEYHKKCYIIQDEKANLLFMNNMLAKEDNFEELQYHFDVKYILVKLGYHLAKITQLNKYEYKNFDFSPFKSIRSLINLPQYFANPLIRLSMLNIDLVEREDDDTFKALSDEISFHAHILPDSFLKPFYTNLTNYCVKQKARGKLEFSHYLYKTYSDMHESNLLLRDDSINIGLLKNIITSACRVDEFVWAKNKLAYYINYVSKQIRNDVLKYNSGIIAFNQQSYLDALGLFAQVKKIDDTHDLGLRIAQLQCFYETDSSFEVGTKQMINSLRVFIKGNKKLVKSQKTAYLNFIYIFSKIYKFKDMPNKYSHKIAIQKTLPKIKGKLIQYDLIREKRWLLHKIEVLEDF